MSKETTTGHAAEHVPMVSVVMTTYNGSAYLRETIDSILQQTYRDFEYVIIDDCSKDDTVALIKGYDDPRIVFVQNPVNMGISESRNAAFRRARGTFIATTDQDDISEPTRLERQVGLLQANPDISAAASRVYLMLKGVKTDDPMAVQPLPVLIHFAVFFGRHNTTYSSLCLRRQFVVDNDLYFRPRYHYAEDFELFTRIVACGRFSIVPDPLVTYRLHANNNSRVHYAEMSANGMSFMKDCYARELGRPVDEAEGWRIWNGLVEKVPPASADELRQLGQVMAELTERFIERHASGQDQRDRLRVLASQIWHDIVDGAVRVRGLGVERVRGEFKSLQAWSPSPMANLKVKARGALSSLRG